MRVKQLLGTYTGKTLDLNNLSVDDICIEDIAHSLSNINRFNGHCPVNLTVARHSVAVAALAQEANESRNTVQHCLMHDAIEAYIGDIVYGIKCKIPAIAELEDEVQGLIYKRFNLGPPQPFRIEQYDRRAGNTECRALMPQLYTPETGYDEGYFRELGGLTLANSPGIDHARFMEAFEVLQVGIPSATVLHGEIV